MMLETHPKRQIYLPFFCYKFQYARVCHGVFSAVNELKEHRVCDVESCEFVEGTGWHEDLSAVVDVFSIWTREHSNGIAPVVFVEALVSSSSSGHHAWRIHPAHHGILLIEAWVKLITISMSCGLEFEGLLTTISED